MSATFRGTDRWGVAHTGVTDVDPAAFVEAKYETHWQWLEVAVDGHLIGRIERLDDGRLTWWVDAAPQTVEPAGGSGSA